MQWDHALFHPIRWQNWIININISTYNEPKTPELFQWECVGNIHHILMLPLLTAGELIPYRMKQLDQFSARIGRMDASEKCKITRFPMGHCTSPGLSLIPRGQVCFWPNPSTPASKAFLSPACYMLCFFIYPYVLQHVLQLAKHLFHCLHIFFF